LTQTPLPGSRWFRWVHNFTLRVGVMTGLYLTAVMVIAILAANRIPFFDPVADVRNWTARAAFVFFMLIPIGCFLRSPVKMIASGMCAWAILSVNYALMGLFFTNLHARLGKTPFHVLILGALAYGMAAAASWVAGMVLLLRQQPIAASRRRM
jgi:hypothetical protein